MQWRDHTTLPSRGQWLPYASRVNAPEDHSGSESVLWRCPPHECFDLVSGRLAAVVAPRPNDIQYECSSLQRTRYRQGPQRADVGFRWRGGNLPLDRSITG